jgi:hypothetical protein
VATNAAVDAAMSAVSEPDVDGDAAVVAAKKALQDKQRELERIKITRESELIVKLDADKPNPNAPGEEWKAWKAARTLKEQAERLTFKHIDEDNAVLLKGLEKAVDDARVAARATKKAAVPSAIPEQPKGALTPEQLVKNAEERAAKEVADADAPRRAAEANAMGDKKKERGFLSPEFDEQRSETRKTFWEAVKNGIMGRKDGAVNERGRMQTLKKAMELANDRRSLLTEEYGDTKPDAFIIQLMVLAKNAALRDDIDMGIKDTRRYNVVDRYRYSKQLAKDQGTNLLADARAPPKAGRRTPRRRRMHGGASISEIADLTKITLDQIALESSTAAPTKAFKAGDALGTLVERTPREAVETGVDEAAVEKEADARDASAEKQLRSILDVFIRYRSSTKPTDLEGRRLVAAALFENLPPKPKVNKYFLVSPWTSRGFYDEFVRTVNVANPAIVKRETEEQERQKAEAASKAEAKAKADAEAAAAAQARASRSFAEMIEEEKGFPAPPPPVVPRGPSEANTGFAERIADAESAKAAAASTEAAFRKGAEERAEASKERQLLYEKKAAADAEAKAAAAEALAAELEKQLLVARGLSPNSTPDDAVRQIEEAEQTVRYAEDERKRRAALVRQPPSTLDKFAAAAAEAEPAHWDAVHARALAANEAEIANKRRLANELAAQKREDNESRNKETAQLQAAEGARWEVDIANRRRLANEAAEAAAEAARVAAAEAEMLPRTEAGNVMKTFEENGFLPSYVSDAAYGLLSEDARSKYKSEKSTDGFHDLKPTEQERRAAEAAVDDLERDVLNGLLSLPAVAGRLDQILNALESAAVKLGRKDSVAKFRNIKDKIAAPAPRRSPRNRIPTEKGKEYQDALQKRRDARAARAAAKAAEPLATPPELAEAAAADAREEESNAREEVAKTLPEDEAKRLRDVGKELDDADKEIVGVFKGDPANIKLSTEAYELLGYELEMMYLSQTESLSAAAPVAEAAPAPAPAAAPAGFVPPRDFAAAAAQAAQAAPRAAPTDRKVAEQAAVAAEAFLSRRGRQSPPAGGGRRRKTPRRRKARKTRKSTFRRHRKH